MTIERELLKQVVENFAYVQDMHLIVAIQKLLNQPEQEAVEDRIARWHRLGYEQGKKASKRPPLTRQQISEGNQSMLNVTRDAFVNGVKWAEKAHGIGEN
jgi:hypothetical protein